MAKESMNEKNNNPTYYEVPTCSVSGCGRTTDLLKHRYSEDLTCESCVNEMVEKLEHEKMIEEEESMNFRDENEALTLFERNK